MAQFKEILDRVRLALTWSSPAGIRALLEVLVKEQIISDAYSQSLSLHQLTEGIVPEPLHSDTAIQRGSTDQGQINQVCREPVFNGHNHTRREFVSLMDEHNSEQKRPKIHPPVMDKYYLHHRPSSSPVYDYQCSLGLEYEVKEVLRNAESMQKPVSDNERITEGNSEDEREWLEQVEEAARRIAVPLWQHWDRGQKMLLPLVASMAAGCATSQNSVTGSEGQCPVLNMEEELELAIACRTLDLYTNNFGYTEIKPNSTLDTGRAGEAPNDLCFLTQGSMVTTGLNVDHFYTPGVERNASPVTACEAAAADTNGSITEGNTDYWVTDRTAVTAEDLLSLTGELQCGFAGFTEDFAHLLSSSEQKTTGTKAQVNLFDSNTDDSMTFGVLDEGEDVFLPACSTKTCSADGMAEFPENKDDEEMLERWGATMQEIEQDPFICPDLGNLSGAKREKHSDLDSCMCPDFGELPDDLSEFLNEDYLAMVIDSNVLFDQPWLNCENEVSNDGDVPMPAELPSPDSHQHRQRDEQTEKTKNTRKRTRAPRSQQRSDENLASRPKRQRTAGQSKSKEAQAQPTVTQGTDTGSEPGPAETVGHSTTTPKILSLHPSIQFITIPDASGYQVVRTLSFSPPVIRLPLQNTPATPTYILVPTASTPCKRQLPPLSPVDAAVVPVQMSSSPPGSLSDTASKTMSPSCPKPLSPSNDVPVCKESLLPQSPTVLEIPQVVKEYIQEAKAHVGQTCQEMEAGLSLNFHYVDVPVCQREIFRSGKNTNRILEKELILMGHTDQQKNLLEKSQIFEGLNGDKPKRYILLFANAGMGKTTLIRKLCLDWSRDCIPQFDFVFLLDGKALTLTESAYSLQTLLLNLSSFALPCMDPEAVYAQILAAPKRVLIIFDRFDELRDYETLLQTQEKDLITSLQKDSKAQAYTVKQLYSAILQRVLLPGCTLLLSTRPRGSANQLLRRTDSLLEVCGFTPTDVETYISQYFTNPALRASALECLKNCSYLHLLCWNPGLCRLVCLVLEQSKSLELLPRTLTGLCHQVLRLTMEKDSMTILSETESESHISEQSVEETQPQISCGSLGKKGHKSAQKKSRTKVHPRTQRSRRTKKQEKEEDNVDEEQRRSDGPEADRTQQRELLSQLSSLAWDSVKANTSIALTGRTISAKLKEFGHRTGLFVSYHLRRREFVSDRQQMGSEEKGEISRNTDTENSDASNDHILLWANPFLQSYLAGVHLSLSRTVSDRAFTQTLPFQSGPKGRRRPQREELELTQQFAVGLLYHDRAELQWLHSYTEATFRDMLVSKQALVVKHLEGLSHNDLSPAQVLQACHYVYEANSTHSGSRDSGSAHLVAHLSANLPEVLTFRGVPLNPSDVFAVQNVLERGGNEGRSFCLDLEDSGIQISGLRALVGLNNINTFRACIADVITLWEQLEQSGEEQLRQGAVTKFKIHPLKATQVCHIEHLAKLVNIHMQKRLPDSSSQSDSILAEGVPAVKELQKLEFELGPENGPLALPKLWELLPGLHNLQHLDLENSKIGDEGAEKLTNAIASLCFLEVLNLSQNSIGDKGVKKLATTLMNLPKLHCLSLYSNVISDEGAECLAAVLPHVASLTDLDVKYNKLTDVGAQSLGVSLKSCKNMKTLRMWNQCIPYGVFERLQQQDNRILCH